jgi:predicted membrane protein
MRHEDQIGYVALISGIITFFYLEFQVLGLAFQFIALFYFYKSIRVQLEEKARKRKVKDIMNTDFSDDTKMILLDIKNRNDFLQIKKTHENNKNRN